MDNATDSLPLLNAMIPAPILTPVDPSGSVVKGAATETLTLENPKVPCLPWARIELHEEGRHWMWSTQHQLPSGWGGRGYKVGKKWGKRAVGREAALHWAVEELTQNVRRADPDSTKGGDKIIQWAQSLH